MTCGIYQIINTLNGKSYIGLSRDIHRRWRQHTGGLNKESALDRGSYPLRRAFLKYGLRTIVSQPGKSGIFEFKIIDKCSENQLIEREKFWINKINPEYNCNIWTPARKKTQESNKPNFWVQYHNFNNLGYVPAESILDDYENQEFFEYKDLVPCISTNRRSILNAIGDMVFLIIGISTRPKHYYLWSRLIIEEVEIIDDDGCLSYHAFGDGWLMNAPIHLNSREFKAFKAYCGNFAFGFMSIKNHEYLSKLQNISATNKPQEININFLDYINKFYEHVISVK